MNTSTTTNPDPSTSSLDKKASPKIYTLNTSTTHVAKSFVVEDRTWEVTNTTLGFIQQILDFTPSYTFRHIENRNIKLIIVSDGSKTNIIRFETSKDILITNIEFFSKISDVVETNDALISAFNTIDIE